MSDTDDLINRIATQNQQTITAQNSSTTQIQRLLDAYDTLGQTDANTSDMNLHKRRHQYQQWLQTPNGHQYQQWENAARQQIAGIITNSQLHNQARDNDLTTAATALAQKDQTISELTQPETTAPYIQSTNPTTDMWLILLEFLGPILLVLEIVLELTNFYIPIFSDILAALWIPAVLGSIAAHFAIKYRDTKRERERSEWATTHFTVQQRDQRIADRLAQLAKASDPILPDAFSWTTTDAKGYAYKLINTINHMPETFDQGIQLPQLRELPITSPDDFDRLAPAMRRQIAQLTPVR